MFSPFYFVFGPIAAVLTGAVWFLFMSISCEKDSELHKRSWRVQSDLEKAQEMERQEVEAELASHVGPSAENAS